MMESLAIETTKETTPVLNDLTVEEAYEMVCNEVRDIYEMKDAV